MKTDALHEDWRQAVKTECAQVDAAIGHMKEFSETYKLIEGAATKWEFSDCPWVYKKKEDLEDGAKETFKRVELFLGQFSSWQQRFTKCEPTMQFGDEPTVAKITAMVKNLKESEELRNQVQLVQSLNVVVPVLLEQSGPSPKLEKAIKYCARTLLLPETSFPEHVQKRMLDDSKPLQASSASASNLPPSTAEKLPPQNQSASSTADGESKGRKRVLKKLL